MKKKTLIRSLLILLPVLAMGLATTGDGVVVYDSKSGVTKYFSYFATEPMAQVQMLLPLAAMLGLASGICGAVYLVKKKEWSLKAIIWTSLIAACAASVPTVTQGDVKVVANVGFPIFMVINWLIASYIQKNPGKFEEKKTKKGKRLNRNMISLFQEEKMKHIHKLLPVVLPVVAALLNGHPHSVRMRFANPDGPFYAYESGFSMVPVGYANWGHMLAGIGACILAVLAALYCLRPTDKLYKVMTVLSVTAAAVLVLCMVMFGSGTLYSWSVAVLLAVQWLLLSQRKT